MSESTREEFEAWAAKRKHPFNGLPFFVMRNNDGSYVDGTTNYAWEGWQASRAALCVELPPSLDMPGEDECGDYEEYEAMEAITCTANGMRHACRNAIHAAGVKTK